LGNLIGLYNSVATAGMGVPPIYNAIAWHSVSGTVGLTSMTCGGSTCPAGLYRFSVYAGMSSGALQVGVYWNDGINSSSTSFSYSTGLTLPGSQTFYSNGSGISYAVPAVTGTPYFSASLERLQ
jgi:hypothetical protein